MSSKDRSSSTESPVRRRRPIRVWKYRGWCWSCRPDYWTRALPCRAGSGYATSGEAADAGTRHLVEYHGLVPFEDLKTAGR